MNLAAIVSAVVVGLVFLVAGVAKAASFNRWRAEATGMKVPRFVVPFVPGVEIVLGAMLVAQVSRTAAAAAAALMLLGFTMVILARLADGERPPCACFGPLSARAIGARDVVRNVVLIVVAMVAALG